MQKQLEEAVQFYTDALHLDSGFVSCISNRATCHLALGNAQACIDDCKSALQLLRGANREIGDGSQVLIPSGPMTPIDQEKRIQWYMKTLVRQGTAHCQLGNLEQACEDYKDALCLDPNNTMLKKDLEKIEDALRKKDGTGVENVKTY